MPTAYIEKPPFPLRIKEHSKVATVVNKSNIRAPRPPEQIKVEPSIAMFKDLLVDNVDGHVICFCNEVARIAKPDIKDKNKPVVGMLVVLVKIGDHCYHGLCDMGASACGILFFVVDHDHLWDKEAPLWFGGGRSHSTKSRNNRAARRGQLSFTQVRAA